MTEMWTKTKRRCLRTTVGYHTVERLEDRYLLAVLNTFVAEIGELQINVDGADAVVITESLGQVKVNGTNPTNDEISADQVRSIVVTAVGEHANVIDLSGVDSSDFPALASTSLSGGAGPDQIRIAAVPTNVDGGEGDDVIAVLGDRATTEVTYRPGAIQGQGTLENNGQLISLSAVEQVHVFEAQRVDIQSDDSLVQIEETTVWDPQTGQLEDALRFSGHTPLVA